MDEANIRKERIERMLNEPRYEVSAEQWEAFNDVLKNPPLPNDALRQLMIRQPPWVEPSERSATASAPDATEGGELTLAMSQQVNIGE